MGGHRRNDLNQQTSDPTVDTRSTTDPASHQEHATPEPPNPTPSTADWKQILLMLAIALLPQLLILCHLYGRT